MTTSLSQQSASEHLLEMITGYWVSQAIYASAKLGIADLLDQGPRSVDELAQKSGAEPESLYRLLRALASRGIFRETENRRFALTELAEQLTKNHPLSLRAVTLLCGDLQYEGWADILHSVRTGQCAYEHRTGRAFFDFLAGDPEAQNTFGAAMTSFMQSVPRSVVEVYDFSRFRKIVDVGGAHGAMIQALLAAHHGLRAVLFDLPHVLPRARTEIQAAGLASRCELVGGDFFEGVPEGGDAYILSTILHDWDDERSVKILESCRKAMTPESRLLLVEMLIQPGNDRFFGKWLDLHMLVMHGGRDRTEAEYRRLLERAGFRVSRVIPTNFLRSVVEAVPV